MSAPHSQDRARAASMRAASQPAGPPVGSGHGVTGVCWQCCGQGPAPRHRVLQGWAMAAPASASHGLMDGIDRMAPGKPCASASEPGWGCAAAARPSQMLQLGLRGGPTEVVHAGCSRAVGQHAWPLSNGWASVLQVFQAGGLCSLPILQGVHIP